MIINSPLSKPVVIIGYSGHGFLAVDILMTHGINVAGYCEPHAKEYNPYDLAYLGNDREPAIRQVLKGYHYFIAIGDNLGRRKVTEAMLAELGEPICMSHASAVISPSVKFGHGVMIGASATVNPLVRLGNGVICSPSSNVDHECVIGDYSHVGPGVTMSGNITVGQNTFIGANATIKQGVRIGDNVLIGAGTVVLKDIPDGLTVIGNPQRELIKKQS